MRDKESQPEGSGSSKPNKTEIGVPEDKEAFPGDASPPRRSRQLLDPNEAFASAVQVVTLITAVIFGAWAIKSYSAAQHANALSQSSLQQTLIANQLTLLSLCVSNPVTVFSSTTNNVAF
jgi:hypothetical protein